MSLRETHIRPDNCCSNGKMVDRKSVCGCSCQSVGDCRFHVMSFATLSLDERLTVKDDGEVIDVRPKTAVLFPAGWEGACTAHETLRNLYMLL